MWIYRSVAADPAPHNSFRFDSAGVPNVVYRPSLNNSGLKLARYSSTFGWLHSVIDATATAGEYNSVALDPVTGTDLRVSYHRDGRAWFAARVAGVWQPPVAVGGGGGGWGQCVCPVAVGGQGSTPALDPHDNPRAVHKEPADDVPEPDEFHLHYFSSP